jgi:ankyrin repeat protein
MANTCNDIAILEACTTGNADHLSSLLANSSDGIDLNRCNPNGSSLVLLACYSQSASCVELLLDKAGDGLDVNRPDSGSRSPLMIACRTGHSECVAMLLSKAGGRIDVNQVDKFSNSALLWAIGDIRSLRILLAKVGDRLHINHRNDFGESALIIACKFSEIECVHSILDTYGEQVDANARDCSSISALHYLCGNNHTDAALRLVEIGASCSLLDANVRTNSKRDVV